jgi:hypothetical protein
VKEFGTKIYKDRRYSGGGIYSMPEIMVKICIKIN